MNAISSRKVDYHDRVKNQRRGRPHRRFPLRPAGRRTGDARQAVLRHGRGFGQRRQRGRGRTRGGLHLRLRFPDELAGQTPGHEKHPLRQRPRPARQRTDHHGAGTCSSSPEPISPTTPEPASIIWPAPSRTAAARNPTTTPSSVTTPVSDGLKTGWVTAAGYNIIVTARQRGHKLIAVILGAPNTGVRAAEARRLLNAGFAAVAKKKSTAIAELGVSAKQARQLKNSTSYSPPRKVQKKRPSRKSAAAAQRQSARKKTSR